MQKKVFWQGIYQKLASPKLTVVIFLVLAAASVVGTLLPQRLSEAELQGHYGQRAIWFIMTFGLNDLYHTGWFRLLLLFLCTNLVVCTIKRLPKTLKIFRRGEEQVDPEKLANCSFNCQFISNLSQDETESRLISIISEEFGSLRRLDGADHFAGVAENGRWSLLMVYVVHLSVLFVLCGALVGSIFGFRGFMNILEGEAVSEVMLEGSDRGLNLPFQVRCDKFDVSYYDNGMPREFRSDLTLIRDGKEILKQELRVNDPLTYAGITFYQASYGAILKDAEVELIDRKLGVVRRCILPFREWVNIPGTRDRAQILRFEEDFRHLGSAMVLLISRDGRDAAGSWILIDRDFHGNKIENYDVKVLHATQMSYTGLQVKQDPGIWLVWLGFAAMLVGTGLTYYVSHRKLWVWAAADAPGKEWTKIVIAGRINRNELSFERKFNSLCDRLQAELRQERGGLKP
ncbi:MAG: cytochrome c biogenesis protein ResB [Syntrophales bacterium]|jgi:cytochrome c biogenesis protein